MAYPKPNKIIAWSFSRYMDYRKCPLLCKLKHIDKIKEPTNDAMLRGAAIHNLAEDFLKGKLRTLPSELKLFKSTFAELKKQYKKKISGMTVEDTWAFRADWSQTKWDDWAGCWLRIKLDCAHTVEDDTLIITDWKTGKFREDNIEDYVEQLDLYALAALILMPHIQKVLPRLAYLDFGIIYPTEGNEIVYTQADVSRLKKLWAKRVKPMLSDTRFAPKANFGCRWCWFGESKKAAGGPGLCKY